MIGKSKGSDLLIGGPSRVSLLPPEVRLRRTANTSHRRLGFAIVLVVLLVLGGSALARALAQQADRNLAIEQANTQLLLVQEQKYVEVRRIQDQIDSIRAAEQVGTSTEINWQQYLTSVQATLPAKVTLSTINIDSETPFAPYTQATAPLQGERIATLSFTAKSSTLPQVPAWLNALTTLPGYADASPGSVTRDETGSYSVSITMHINKAAFTNRFATVVK